jgi:type II secretory pathway component PulJ
MGSSTILDILGSFIVFGLLFIMALRLNASATENNSAYYANYILQRNLIILVTLLEDDFKRIGYCKVSTNLPNPADAIVYCDSNKFAFLTDIQNNGGLDRIEYSLGPTSELTETPNPRDRFLYRKVNSGTADRWNLGITQFKFQYYNYLEDVMTYAQAAVAPSNVGLVDLSVQLESPSPMQQEYMQDTTQYQIFWRQIRLSSKNLRNR